jgi:hypothetical protein
MKALGLWPVSEKMVSELEIELVPLIERKMESARDAEKARLTLEDWIVAKVSK